MILAGERAGVQGSALRVTGGPGHKAQPCTPTVRISAVGHSFHQTLLEVSIFLQDQRFLSNDNFSHLPKSQTFADYENTELVNFSGKNLYDFCYYNK